MPADAGRPAPIGERPNPRDRSTDQDRAPVDRSRPEADGHPRRRSAARQRSGRDGADPSASTPAVTWLRGSGSCRARTPAAARNGSADHQAGRPLSATAAVRRRHGRDPLRRAAWHPPAVAGAVAGTPPTKVATVRSANKIARIAWAIMTSGERYREPDPAPPDDQARAPTDLEGRTTAAADRPVDTEGQENPLSPLRLQARDIGRDPSSRKALWPAAMCAASTGRTHGRTDQRCAVQLNPCQRSAVHTWRFANDAVVMRAFITVIQHRSVTPPQMASKPIQLRATFRMAIWRRVIRLNAEFTRSIFALTHRL